MKAFAIAVIQHIEEAAIIVGCSVVLLYLGVVYLLGLLGV